MKINWDNVEFKNEKRYLSNMFPCYIKADISLQRDFPMFTLNNEEYPSSENLYQSLKTSIPLERAQFLNCSPIESKGLGRKVTIRPDWEKVKVDAMKLCLTLKFTQNPELAKKLLDTGDEPLEERNDWNDKFWGTYLGKGENTLGILLMELREALKGLK